ncbi:MAG: hypothetical protein H6970_01715 [Gammaproteobacteria bacterium]|nr:hypothetical protein [Gammaproteobacteria bacterium]MCP5423776.1 hypothetical protein [Gammaproteobacteria bacterium]
MRQSPNHAQRRDAVLLLLIFAAFMLASPFFRWLATSDRPWYLPYLVWGGIIVFIFLIQRHYPHDGQ